MKVICAGFPKTGTKTLNAALTELGYNCFDYLENYRFLGDEWTKIFKEGGTTEDFRKMFENIDAVMDIPCCHFWEEIHKAFPDAKIIFSERASEDAWWKSMNNQLTSNNSSIVVQAMRYLSPSFRMMNAYGIQLCMAVFRLDFSSSGWFKPTPRNELLLRKAYRTHNTYLLKTAPKDKLFIINFEDGWEPLCQFLGVPVPNTPFPHKNKNATVIKEALQKDPFLIRLQREMMVSGSLIICLFGFGVYKLVTRPSVSSKLWNCATSPISYFTDKLGHKF